MLVEEADKLIEDPAGIKVTLYRSHKEDNMLVFKHLI
jgi:hypothetical protein